MGTRFSALVQTGPEAHPASYAMSNGSFLGVKWPERGVGHPYSSSKKVKVKQSRNRPGVAQRVPGGLDAQIFMTHEGGEVVSLTHRPPLPPGMFLVLIFTMG